MRLTVPSISVCCFVLLAGCGGREEGMLNVFHAGSLSVPFEKLEAAFEKSHPGIDVRRYAYGSADAIRQVTELGKPADIVASADYALIDKMMIDAEPKWADWNLLFARNAMCLALSRGSQDIASDNWADRIDAGGLRVGMSNPNQDPCGYRTLMTLYLAQTRLGKGALFDALILGNTNITVDAGTAGTSILVPAALETREAPESADTARGGSMPVVRPKETDLVPLLQTGAIDCLFIYRSVAVQHGLPFAVLPAEVDLSEVAQEKEYARVSVRLNADSAAPVDLAASPIVYGLTIVSGAANEDLAKEFVRLVASPSGREILESCGQPPVTPVTLSVRSGKPDFVIAAGEE